MAAARSVMIARTAPAMASSPADTVRLVAAMVRPADVTEPRAIVSIGLVVRSSLVANVSIVRAMVNGTGTKTVVVAIRTAHAPRVSVGRVPERNGPIASVAMIEPAVDTVRALLETSVREVEGTAIALETSILAELSVRDTIGTLGKTAPLAARIPVTTAMIGVRTAGTAMIADVTLAGVRSGIVTTMVALGAAVRTGAARTGAVATGIVTTVVAAIAAEMTAHAVITVAVAPVVVGAATVAGVIASSPRPNVCSTNFARYALSTTTRSSRRRSPRRICTPQRAIS